MWIKTIIRTKNNNKFIIGDNEDGSGRMVYY